MNVLILAGGEDVSSSDRAAYPLWLSEVGGTTILERQVRSFGELAPNRFVFAFRRENVQDFHLDQIAGLMAESVSVIEISKQTQGAACTALLAIEEIDQDAELIVVSATDLIDVPLGDVIEGFRKANADAGVITFSSVHPRYAYVRCDEAGLVIEAAEKRPISRNAVAGFYWFARGRDFFSGVMRMIAKDASVNGRFFIAPALNELILELRRVVIHPIKLEQYHPVKAQQHVDAFEHFLEGR